MKGNVKRVFYVRYVAHPCYFEIIAQRPEIRLDKLENETADNAAAPILAAAHAYQIGSARGQLNPRLHAPGEVLWRRANLLFASPNRPGFHPANGNDSPQAAGLSRDQDSCNPAA